MAGTKPAPPFDPGMTPSEKPPPWTSWIFSSSVIAATTSSARASGESSRFIHSMAGRGLDEGEGACPVAMLQKAPATSPAAIIPDLRIGPLCDTGAPVEAGLRAPELAAAPASD